MATISGIVVSTGGKAEGRRTFKDIIDELSRPVAIDDSTVRALAADSFRAAVRRMNRKGLWPWEVLDEDINITANEIYSTATGAIKKPLAMHFLHAEGGKRDQRITYTPYDRFVERYNMNVASEPYTYTIPNLYETGQIRWFPTPNSADYTRFTYYRMTPDPRNENEPVEIPAFVTDAYVQMAWLEFVKRLPSEQRPFPITVAMGMSNDAFREISAHVNAPGDRVRFMEDYGFG